MKSAQMSSKKFDRWKKTTASAVEAVKNADARKALKLFSAAAELAEKLGEPLYSKSLSNLSLVLASTRRRDQAIKKALECLGLNPQPSAGIRAHLVLAECEAAKDSIKDAKAHLEAAQSIITEMRAAHYRNHLWVARALVEYWAGNYSDASSILKSTAKKAERANEGGVVAVALTDLGFCQIFEKKPKAATASLSKAVTLSEGERDRWTQAMALKDLAIALYLTGFRDECMQATKDSLQLTKDKGQSEIRWAAFFLKARCIEDANGKGSTEAYKKAVQERPELPLETLRGMSIHANLFEFRPF